MAMRAAHGGNNRLIERRKKFDSAIFRGAQLACGGIFRGKFAAIPTGSPGLRICLRMHWLPAVRNADLPAPLPGNQLSEGNERANLSLVVEAAGAFWG
jgi:hypothetical protein